MTKNSPIQIMLVLGVISLLGIIAVQVYWVTLSVSAEEETFDHNVRMSLRAVADNMCQIDGNELIPSKPIDRISRNYFVARLQYNIDVSVLDSLLKYQFETRNINQDYDYGVYNCESDQLVFGNQVKLVGGVNDQQTALPKLAADEYYFGVFFPNKTGGLLASLQLWKYMTVATCLMLGFFSYGMIIVLKQRRLSEIQKDFIDNVTHELKTPLATLKLSAEALQQSNDVTKNARYAAIIGQETQRLEEQVNHILSSSFVERNRASSKDSLNINQLIKTCIDQFQDAFDAIRWELHLDDIGMIVSDRDAWQTIIKNLLDNAVKYGNGEVTVALTKEKNIMKLTISDNGPGIPKQFHQRIFDKFFRIPTANLHDVKGYGLGMYLVKMNVRHLGATITLSSNEKGSHFTINYPKP